LRLCFFLASRAASYLFIAFVGADFFSALAFVSCPVPGSEIAVGVVLMFFSFKSFQRNGNQAHGGPAQVVEAKQGSAPQRFIPRATAFRSAGNWPLPVP
jgi:hypothetical protein